MTGLWIALGIIAAIIVIIVIYVIRTYNKFIKLNNRVENAWAQVNVQLQRRYDLIPNLVETVKGYAAHESEVLANVTAARTAAMNASTPAEQIERNNELTEAMKSLFAVAENYPQLRANENFLQLQDQLADCENRIGHMRQSFNDTVMKYNTAIATFPAVLVAARFRFTGYELYASEPEAAAVPKVSF